MLRIIRPATAILAATTLSACTTVLKTENVSVGGPPGYGILYNLPRAAFDVEAKFLITGCERKLGNISELSFELTNATVQHKLVGDPTETYRLRYDKLNSPLKITSASVVMHPNGMIKSINVEQDDRTAQVMASLAATAINLYKASTVGIGVASGVQKADERCDAVVANRLDDRRKMTESLAGLRQADALLTADIAAADELAASVVLATAKLAEVKKGGNPGDTAKAQAEFDLLSAQWKVANAKLTGRSKAAPAVQAKLDKITSELTATARLLNWAPAVGQLCKNVQTKQVDFLGQLAQSQAEKLTAPPLPLATFDAEVCVTGAAEARTSAAGGKVSPTPGQNGEPPDSEKVFEGVVYRLPAMAAVTVAAGGVTLTGATSVPIPQLGARAMLWLENQPFDQNAIQAAFNEDGSLGSMTFKALASRAERGAAALADTSKSLIDLMQLRADAAKAKSAAASDEEKKEHQRQLDALDRQIAVLNKQRDLETARAPTTDPLDKEKDRLSKQIDVEKLRQEYEALKKKGSGS